MNIRHDFVLLFLNGGKKESSTGDVDIESDHFPMSFANVSLIYFKGSAFLQLP